MNKILFLDTYALVKLAKDPEYLEKEEKVVTFATNLIELHYILLRDYDEEVADLFAKKYASIVKPMDLLTIMGAMKWRFSNRKKKFSYADALGYYYALTNNMKFVTGDQAFKGMKNVVIER